MIFRKLKTFSHLKINLLKTIWSFKMKPSSFKFIRPVQVEIMDEIIENGIG